MTSASRDTPGASSRSSAPDEQARPATDTDAPVIVTLATTLREHMNGQRGGPLWAARDALAPPTGREIRARLADPDLATMVGTLDGHVVAYGLAHTETVPGVGLLGVIDELFVAEPARAVSVGATLLGTLVAWCRDAACVGIDATALPGDREAKNFFESAGFKARRLVMHTSLN